MSNFGLLITVRLHDDRWHGVGDWPPSPMRLFQALIAGACAGAAMNDEDRQAFAWLERLAAPVIAAPTGKTGASFTNFVPNNDLDAVGGDPSRIAKIRAGKPIRPRLLDPTIPFLYLWRFEDDEAHARRIVEIALKLYQFGRGVDMAYATAAILRPEAAEQTLAHHPGPVRQPTETGGGGKQLRCPTSGTLASLLDRHEKQAERLRGGLLRQPPPARFRLVSYDSPPDRLLFDLKTVTPGRPRHPWPLAEATTLAHVVRDQAIARARAEYAREKQVPPPFERVLKGSPNDGEDAKSRRVRIVPLPSVGHFHTDPSIRQVLIERPPDCPVALDAIAWALSGLDLGADYDTGEINNEQRPRLAPATGEAMLRHYGIGMESAARVWRTITPAVLPQARRERGRIRGGDRLDNEQQAACAVRRALRHAEVRGAVERIRVQREPFSARGARAEAFVIPSSRFEATRLWHVEIVFAEPIAGPLIIGDGRYCGLGLMIPEARLDRRDVAVFTIDPCHRPPALHRAAVVSAFRRALMSLAADENQSIATLFSGHEKGPGPARSGLHKHIYLFADDADEDGLLDRLIVAAPWRVDRRHQPALAEMQSFERVTRALRILRAGPAGVLLLGHPHAPGNGDLLFGSASTWVSRTPYWPTRHPARTSAASAVARADIRLECARRGLPRPEIELSDIRIGPRGGLAVDARLIFPHRVEGPIALGRKAHHGEGFFVRAPNTTEFAISSLTKDRGDNPRGPATLP